MKKTYSGLKVQQYVGRLTFNHGDASFDNSSEDAQLMRDCLFYVDAMIEDLLPDSVEGHRCYMGWISSLVMIDVMAFGEMLKRADGFFKDFILDPYAISSLKCFKRTFRGTYLGYFSPIFSEIDDFLTSRGTKPFRIINTYVNFLRRVNLPGLDLAAVCEQEYLRFEQDYPAADIVTLNALEPIITEWFSSFSYSDFIPKHGPGSVAGYVGKLPVVYKYSDMQTDERLQYLSKYIGDINGFCPVQMKTGLNRCSEIVCVPKSIITNRTISREPCSLQYFQQGVRKCIVDHIRHHDVLSKHITLHDQTKSQDLARYGSICGDFATIDLSSASDSVSLFQVKRMFRRVPALLAGLICTRSDYTKLPSGTIIQMKKFAPMGSATCFPIETIVFSACCELAARRRGHISRYRVYGDDIIIEEELVDELLNILNACGFIVNHSKSFSGACLHNFREACGVEYYDGESVRPFRIPRFFRGVPKNSGDVSADRVSSVLAFSNQAFDRGYVTMRNCVLSQLQSVFGKFSFLPFSTDGRQGIQTYADCCTNWKVHQRYDVDVMLSVRKCRDFGRLIQYKPMLGSTWTTTAYCIVSMPEYDALRDKKCRDQFRGRDVLEEDLVRYFEWLRLHASDTYSSSKDEVYTAFVDPLIVPEMASERISIRPTRNVLHQRWIYIQR